MQTIPLSSLLIAFVPALAVVGIQLAWSLKSHTVLYALGRMLFQLMVIGYLLTFIFQSESAGLIIGILAVMILASSWISLRPIAEKRRELLKFSLIAVSVSGLFVLFLITQGVLGLSPWFTPHYLIPLAGMIFSSAMNSVSIAAERFYAELEQTVPVNQAKLAAFNVALVPTVNSLFAVGLVSLPGMMTGQILSGVSPLIAVRYQIMVMCMIFGVCGIAAALFLTLAARRE